MKKLKRIDIAYKKGRWVAKRKGKKVDKASTKAELVSSVTTSVRAKGKPTSVRIHKKDGQIQEERTYPRSANQRRPKG